MYPLLIVIFALLIVALYPVIRDFIKQRKITVPSYVAGLQFLLDGKFEDAKIKLKYAVEEDTNNIDAYIRLGQIFFTQGDIDRALRIHESLLLRRNLKPEEEYKIYLSLVDDYLKIGRRVKAIPLLEEIVRQKKNDYYNRERLLNLYIETATWEKAERLLREIPRTETKRVALLYARFGLVQGKQNPKIGLLYLRKALDINPRCVPAYVYLGDLLFAQGDIGSAISTWNKLLDFAPDKNHLIRDRLERAYYESGRYDEILTFYRKLLNRIPQDYGLVLTIVRIYVKKEEITNALNLLEKYANTTEPQILITLAALNLRKGNPENAQKYLEQILTLSSPVIKCPGCGIPLDQYELYCVRCQTWVNGVD